MRAWARAALCAALAGCAATDDAHVSRGPLASGHRLMASGDPGGALRAFREAATRGEGGEAIAGMGAANLALGRLGQAEPLLRRATELEPRSPAAWNNLGVLLMETSRPAEAAACFARAHALGAGRSDTVSGNLSLALQRREGSGYGGPSGASDSAPTD